MTPEITANDDARANAGTEIFVILSAAGSHRDHTRETRKQPYWDEHAAFIDRLVDEGFIMMGGPLDDEGGALLIVHADDETGVKEKLAHDPWYREGILKLESIKRWKIYIDQRS